MALNGWLRWGTAGLLLAFAGCGRVTSVEPDGSAEDADAESRGLDAESRGLDAAAEDWDATMRDPDAGVATVTAGDQTLDDLSTVVSIDHVRSFGAGWVAVHEGNCDDGATVLGHARVAEGDNVSLQVALERPAIDAEALCAVIHEDDPADDTFTFDPGAEVPEDDKVKLPDGTIAMDAFTVEVVEGTPAVRIALSADGSTDYIFDRVEPALHDTSEIAGQKDPEMPLRHGWRYEVVNTAVSSHPFELIDGEEDVVHLSQAGSGSSETDPDVDWLEDEELVQFTVNGAPFDAIDRYQCAFHLASMTSTVVVQSEQ